MRAIVVGGGIGGLAAASGLARLGWEVRVFERAGVVGEVGSGLSLWPNGLRALDALGVGERVRGRGLPEMAGGIRDPRGRWLSRIDTAEFERRYGSLVMIHRADLFDILAAALPAGALRLGITVRSVIDDERGATVEHSAGADSADLVIGADGIRSAVRSAVWPRALRPRYCGYTTWRVVTRPVTGIASGGESWGRGERFGIAPLIDGRLYLFAAANAPAGGRAAGGEFEELRRRFGSWHDPVPRLLDAVDPDSVLRHDIYDLPDLPSFVRRRVALLGDAAHAMTPNLGQGANQALEDAATLTALLRDRPVDAGLAAYDRLRRPRAQAIARRSRRVGVVAQWSHPFATFLRDSAIRLVPPALALRGVGPTASWRPELPATCP
ncbi:FAD-dependent monooxygenase [Nocardia sp. CDC159]|uniref:FAD-dependent monooxygenase n=1 Tax=Nocardia pulmonis TaxID=2951408 RepID=A0A9X2E352_9NOCA|nr:MULTISPECIES: FAD-dependent monooxygenase [Nocardia]MCM6773267.1 FAD-dependent monooxygenase [Nocardia pulmonis]MCM6786154.1 FAD-dependent monooxygenase [Nocardia sp. CDC159]